MVIKDTVWSVYIILYLVTRQKLRKPQERTAVTRDLLLRSAEKVFARVGYERAQVEEVAAAAGFSKGGLYAHFKSKEELFLALYNAKTAGYQAKLRVCLDEVSIREGIIDAFRSFYIDLSKDKEWALIVLEVKLFVRRHPEVSERFRQLEAQDSDSIRGELCRLFGESARAAGEALGGIFSALVLEAELEPDVLSEQKMREILGTIFDALLRLPSKATSIE